MKFLTLRNYQKEAINFFLNKKKTALFLKIGHGKTVVALYSIKILFEKKLVKKALILAPLRLCQNTWPDEIKIWEQFKNFDFSVAIGSKKEREKAIKNNSSITLINNDNLAWLVDNFSFDYDVVIIDESSAFKSAKTVRFKKLKKVINFSKFCCLLSATPAPNGITDLWSQIFLLDQGERLGKSRTAFENRFFYYPFRGSYTPLPHVWAEKKVYQLISDIIFTTKKKDEIELPEKIEIIEKLTFTKYHKKQYTTMKTSFFSTLKNETVTAPLAVTKADKLRQICNGFIYNEKKAALQISNEKIEAVKELIFTNSDTSFFISYIFKHDEERLKRAFPFSKNIKEPGALEDWNSRKLKILLAHPASSAHGINAQFGGSDIIWFSLPWSSELFEQLNGRLHRSGQKNTVKIHYFLYENSIEFDILEILKRKITGQKAMFNFLMEKEEKKSVERR